MNAKILDVFTYLTRKVVNLNKIDNMLKIPVTNAMSQMTAKKTVDEQIDISDGIISQNKRKL